MRNLDEMNPMIAKPGKFIPFGMFVPACISGSCTALAYGAAPHVKLFSNPISVLCILIFVFSCIIGIAAKFMKLGWEAKYFGISLLCVSSAALLSIIPWLCILLYSTLGTLEKSGISSIFLLTHIMWCNRFINAYKKIRNNSKMWESLYFVDEYEIYYLQKVDISILNNDIMFNQIPPTYIFVASILFSISLIPAIQKLTLFTGLPFAHTFLLISAFPVSLLASGITTRALLIFYYYPHELLRKTGKKVYVDMATGIKN